MKILVPVKRVVDANIKVKVGPEGKLDVANLKHSMNPFDEIALEQAVQMKEKGIANEVIAVSVGDTKSQETLRTALAMGADKGVLIQTDKPFEAEPLNVAKLISAYVKQVNPDLIICGKQAVDNDSNQVGQMIAAICGVLGSDTAGCGYRGLETKRTALCHAAYDDESQTQTAGSRSGSCFVL